MKTEVLNENQIMRICNRFAFQILENSIDSDFLNKTKEELHAQLFSLWIEKQEEDKAFKEKMQRQLLALNNKILRLLGD